LIQPRPLSDQHRNPIDNRIPAGACCANQAGFFQTKVAEARRTGKLVEYRRVKGKISYEVVWHQMRY